MGCHINRDGNNFPSLNRDENCFPSLFRDGHVFPCLNRDGKIFFSKFPSLFFNFLVVCENLETLLNSLGNLTCLCALLVHNCPRLQKLPDSLRSLQCCLKTLDLSGCNMVFVLIVDIKCERKQYSPHTYRHHSTFSTKYPYNESLSGA